MSPGSFPLYRIRATDAAGVEYDKFGGGGVVSDGGLSVTSQVILFSTRNRKGEDNGPPAQIVISLPAKVREIEVPMQFKDLPMP